MEVVKDLTCPICLEFYSHPIILPCSHVMCRQPCAENVFEGNFIRCPVCRDNCYVSGGISSLPRVITIESIIEKIRADRKKRTAADRTQRREPNPDDLSTEMTPDGWMFKTNLDDLLSDIGSDRTSPDIFHPKSTTSVRTDGILEHGHLNGQPAVASHSPPALIPMSVTLPRPSISEIGISPSLHDVCGDSPRLRTPSDHTVRRSQHLFLSSHFPPNSFSSGSPVSVSTSRDRTSSTCFGESYSLSQRSQTNDGNRHQRLSSSPVFHRSQTSECHFLPGTSSHSHNTSINQTRNNDSRNDPLTTSTDQASETLQNQNRQNSSVQTTTATISIANNINSSGTPIVSISRIHQTINPAAPRSTRCVSNSIDHYHERSITNLQACSNSILDLQSEYLALTNQLEIRTPREDSQTESSSSATNAHCLNPNPSQPTPHLTTQASGVGSSGFEPRVSYNLTRQNDTGEVTRAIPTSRVPNLGLTHLDVSATGNLESRGEHRDLVKEINSYSNVKSSEEEDDPLELSDDDLPSPDRAIANDFKLLLQSQLEKLCQTQSQLMHHMSAYRTHAQREQTLLEQERQELNKECDSLVAEIEHKRSHFLLQLGDEEKHGSSNLNDVTVAMETLLESTQHLTQFVGQMLESKPELLLNTASNVFDRLSRAVQECESCLQESVSSFPDFDTSSFHIDTRVQRSVIADLDYLDSPSRPNIDTQRCARNTHTVALVLTPPSLSDVIDQYEVCYCSEEQKNLGIEERYYAKQSAEVDVHDVTNGSFPVILIENLCQATHYYFCVCAVNRKGSSLYSDYVQCLTLGEQECVVPVPTIMDKLCRATSTCVQLVCPSLVTVTAHQEVGHYLLQRREQGAFVWKGRELFQKDEEFLVTKLRPKTRYFFIVMAYNKRGECQLALPSTFDTT